MTSNIQNVKKAYDLSYHLPCLNCSNVNYLRGLIRKYHVLIHNTQPHPYISLSALASGKVICLCDNITKYFHLAASVVCN